MNRPADIDKMVSSFLSELNSLCNSLGLTPDKAPADLPAPNEQRNPDDYGRITPTDAEPRAGTQHDLGTENAKNGRSRSPTNSKCMPCRNIDVLLMSDSRFIAGMRRNPEEFYVASNAPGDATSPKIPYQPRLKVQVRLHSCGSLWATFTTWIQRFRGRGGAARHSVQPSKPKT